MSELEETQEIILSDNGIQDQEPNNGTELPDSVSENTQDTENNITGDGEGEGEKNKNNVTLTVVPDEMDTSVSTIFYSSEEFHPDEEQSESTNLITPDCPEEENKTHCAVKIPKLEPGIEVIEPIIVNSITDDDKIHDADSSTGDMNALWEENGFTNFFTTEEEFSAEEQPTPTPTSLTNPENKTHCAVKIPKLEPGIEVIEPIIVNSITDEDKVLDVDSSTRDVSALWEENGCIVCNCNMRIDAPENLVLSNVELKSFFAKMLGLGEGLQLDQEMTYPFCDTCTNDVTQLKSIAQKIEFMHRQFNKIRDSLARKTVKTFLIRKEPELMKKEAEDRLTNANYDAENPVTLKDTIYNRWKARYEINSPGPKCPLIIKTMDAKGRTTVVRMNQQDSKEVLKHIPLARCGNRSVKEVRRMPVLKLEDNQETSLTDAKNEYKCKDCHKAFSTSNMLAYHSRIHSGELPFECELCGKGFAVPHYLMIHMRSHTGEKPYKCEVCGKGFAQRGGLVTHNLVHSGDKPFECTQCGKSFRQKYHLTQHLLIHSGAKPFGCDICGKFFNVKMNLREHMRRHTGDRPYKCPYCLIIGFFRKKMLRDHITKAHPTKQLPGELENISETKPQVVRRSSTEANTETTPAKRMRGEVKIKTESSSGEESYSPSPSPTQDEDSSTSTMKRIRETEEGEYIEEEIDADEDPIAILAN